MRCTHFLVFLLVIALSPIATAQVPSVEDLQKAVQSSAKEADALRDVANKLKEQNDDLRKRVEGKEATLWDHYYKAKEGEYDFQIEMMNVNSRSFQHQNVASYVILALVVFVVGGGLYFAHIQLMAGLQPITTFTPGAQTIGTGPATNDKATATPTTGNTAAPPPAASSSVPLGTTTLAAEVGKVTVTSSVVGVIVLVISLAFLYIYTREVYRIQVVDPFRPILNDPVPAESARGAKTVK